MKNYRPVSILTNLSNPYEKCLKQVSKQVSKQRSKLYFAIDGKIQKKF